jgi:sporulation protein YlmC with PRC-barrel domain
VKRLKIIFALLLAVSALPANAQAPTPEEIVQELIGAPVHSADGREVGTVYQVTSDEAGSINGISMKTAAFLGIGERVVTLPEDSYLVLRGAVVLDWHAEELEGLLPSDPPR